MNINDSDKPRRITRLYLFYEDGIIPFKVIAQKLWRNKLKELKYIKNKKVRRYKCWKYFINELYKYDLTDEPFNVDFIRKNLHNFFTLMYYYILATEGKIDYGDAVYFDLKKYFYYKYGI